MSADEFHDPILRWVFNEAERQGIHQVRLGAMVGMSQSAVSKVRRKQATTLANARDMVQALDYELIVVPGQQNIVSVSFDGRFMPAVEQTLRINGFDLALTPDLDELPVRCWVARQGERRR